VRELKEGNKKKINTRSLKGAIRAKTMSIVGSTLVIILG